MTMNHGLVLVMSSPFYLLHCDFSLQLLLEVVVLSLMLLTFYTHAFAGFSSPHSYCCEGVRAILFWIAPYHIWSTTRKWKSSDIGSFLFSFLTMAIWFHYWRLITRILKEDINFAVVFLKVLQILTQDTTPSSDLISTVKRLYETKFKVCIAAKSNVNFSTNGYIFVSFLIYASPPLQDVTILVPLLSSLSKQEVILISFFFYYFSIYILAKFPLK